MVRVGFRIRVIGMKLALGLYAGLTGTKVTC